MEGLEARDIRFHAGGMEILKGVSLAATPGEIVAIMGPSGCGKTTFLRVAAGLDAATSGDLSFGGEAIHGVPAHRRGFGMMFQDHALFPHLDVAGNIEFGLKRAGWGKERRDPRVSELLDLVGLPGFGRRRIDKLSGGERQRVALARALAPNPRLLMLDEPLASLDRRLRERLAGELRGILGRLGIPVLYVTHDREEAFALADRLIVMDSGRVVRAGTPRSIWEAPETEFVARFLGLDTVVRGQRDSQGTVTTPFGSFGPIPGENGQVTLLLRPEFRPVQADEPNVVSGSVESISFRGEDTVVGVQAGGERLALPIAGRLERPAPGGQVHIAVGRVQEIAAEAGSGLGL